MKFDAFLKQATGTPILETSMLLTGIEDPVPYLVQINRWEKSGKLIQIKRGIYLLAGEYRRNEIFEPYLASALVRPSYLSLDKALEIHGMIPEAVTVFTSVTTKRPGQYAADGVRFEYRHIRPSLFWGYQTMTMKGQVGYVATPEKALLDLFYFRNGPITFEYIEGLRLQNMENIDMNKLQLHAARFKKPKITKATAVLQQFHQQTVNGEISL